jgi:hypothetical protein
VEAGARRAVCRTTRLLLQQHRPLPDKGTDVSLCASTCLWCAVLLSGGPAIHSVRLGLLPGSPPGSPGVHQPRVPPCATSLSLAR